MNRVVFWTIFLGMSLAPLIGCGSDEASDDDVSSTEKADSGPTGELAVSADFLNGTLSIIDVDKLVPGATRTDALVSTVDLSAYTPGPMALAITPDGKTAVVSNSSGLLGFLNGLPSGDDSLLFVDLEQREVTDSVDVGSGPMGIAVTPDGKQAFVGLFWESYFAVVDIEDKTFETVQTGGQFNEYLSMDDTGTVAALSYGLSGNIMTFSVADPANVISQTNGLQGGAAGVAFFPGTKTAYLVQAPSILSGGAGGHDLIDVSSPEAPTASDPVREDNYPEVYPVEPVAARGTLALPVAEDGMMSLVEVALMDGQAIEMQRIPVGPTDSFAYGLTATRDGRVLIAVPDQHYVGVVDLEAGTAFTVPWEVDMIGPTEIKVLPVP